jgi:peptidyl-prolyl cis-trans isomerase C
MSARKGVLASLAGVAVLAIVAGSAPAQAPPAAKGKPPAVVNGEVITAIDVEAALKQLPPSPVQLTEEKRRQMQFEAVSMLIDEVLMKQFLRKNAPPASKGDVDKRLADLADALKKQGKTVAEFLKENNQTDKGLRDDLAAQVQWRHYVTAHVAEADVQKYYRDYKDFFDRVTVHVSHIVMRVPPTASEAERAPVRAKLAELRKQIVENKLDFAAAAKASSECPSAKDGGDLGFIPRKWMVDEAFARVAFALPVGQVSDIVQTDYGLHLIKVTERKPGQPSDYNKIKDEVREIYVEDLRQAILNQERKAAKVEINLP